MDHNKSKLLNSKFITQDDIDLLKTHNVDLEKDYPIFLKEFAKYLKYKWSKEFHNDITHLEKGDIDSFNDSLNHPSWTSYHILDDTFTGPCSKLDEIMSNKSKSLFGYFYGIHLR